MSAPCLPGLFPTGLEAKRHRTVREVSRTLYQEARARLSGRPGETLRLLAAFYNRKQYWPTAGELAAFCRAELEGNDTMDFTARKQHLSRGLTELQETREIQAVPNGQRRCQATGRTVETWRVTPRS
jgi:hypothetical protein